MDHRKLRAIEIRTAANGYMLAEAPSRENPLPDKHPYVFEQLASVIDFIKQNLAQPKDLI